MSCLIRANYKYYSKLDQIVKALMYNVLFHIVIHYTLISRIYIGLSHNHSNGLYGLSAGKAPLAGGGGFRTWATNSTTGYNLESELEGGSTVYWYDFMECTVTAS